MYAFHVIGQFSDVLNCDNPVNDIILQPIPNMPATPYVNSLPEPLFTAVIFGALLPLPKGRAPGSDGISMKLLQIGVTIVIGALKKLADCVWEEEAVPADWWKQFIVFMFKNKGSRNICDNYRGISLLSAARKIFSKAILSHIERVDEYHLSESKCGFHHGHSSADQIFSLRTAMERSQEFRHPVYIAFIDLRKAYDSVNRAVLWNILQRGYNIPVKRISIIQILHNNTHASVTAYSKNSPSLICVLGSDKAASWLLSCSTYSLILSQVGTAEQLAERYISTVSPR